jgi:hypothetical protein
VCWQGVQKEAPTDEYSLAPELPPQSHKSHEASTKKEHGGGFRDSGRRFAAGIIPSLTSIAFV